MFWESVQRKNGGKNQMKKVKLVPALLSASLLLQTVPSYALPVYAQGSSYTDLRVSDAAATDVSQTRFTGKEWTGTTYTDLNNQTVGAEKVFAVNREQSSAQIIDYQSQEAAVNAVWNFAARENSSYMQKLTGEGQDWDLTVVENPEAAEKFLGENGFMHASYTEDPADGWKTVSLPCSWTQQGFDYAIYTNQNMPFQGSETFYRGNTASQTSVYPPLAPTIYNPVGLYRKTFTVDEDLTRDGRRVYINFNGVESAYYLYVNGHEVGYSEDSFSPHKFDITDFLQEGENFLAVKVHKFCDGTWFEDQDMIYDGGIFRDVFLTSAPLVQIRDYFVTTDLDENFEDADLNVKVDLKNMADSDISDWSVEALAFDRAGNQILNNASAPAVVASNSTSELSITTHVENPALWSAENPNLYALVLVLKDGTGHEVQRVSTQLGFREINFTRTPKSGQAAHYDPITINGMPLQFKGADRHDSDPVYGKYVPEATIREDLRLMKEYNLNAIRTSHYSNDDYLYWLANEWGLYVLAETNAECHALFAESYNDDKAKFKEAVIDREDTAFHRLKNNPSIVMWSIGNEIGYPTNPNAADSMFNDAVWYFKDRDTTRPVHCESLSAGNGFGVDVASSMYGSQSYVSSMGGSGRIPYMQCEYAHAMGNSVGGLKEYWEAFRSADNILGGFIWDWVDQSRAKDIDAVKSWSLTDETGVPGEIHGSETSWNHSAGEGSLTGTSFSGYTVMGNPAKYNEALSGSNKSFTMEVVVRPKDTSQNNIFIAKGDNQVSLKTHSQNNNIEFFVYGNSWSSMTAPLPEDWVGNWHQLAVVYDKGATTIYIDGEVAATANLSSTISSNDTALGVGFDADYNRTLKGDMSLARIYTRALSQEEIAGQYQASPAITSNDESVLLWVDYSSSVTENVKTGWDYYGEGGTYSGIYGEEMSGKYHAYGGDWGDTPNDNSFCANGLISGDRQAQPELYEVKYQYQSLWFSADINQLDRREVSVYNENAFTDLSAYDLHWEVLEDGLVVDEGTFEGSCAPRTTGTVTVPFTMPEQLKDGAVYHLNLYAALKEDEEWASAGHTVAYEQIQLPASVRQAAPVISQAAVTVTENDEEFAVTGEDFSFAISKADGTMGAYTYKGETLLEKGPVPNFWRAKTENDENEKNSAYDTGWRAAANNISVESVTASVNEAGQNVITAQISFPDAQNTKETMVYTIDGSGKVTVSLSVDATKTSMKGFIRVGSMMTLPAGYESVSWFGNGPVESYNDRKEGAKQGVWSSTVDDFFYPYIHVDDSGNLTDVNWISVKSDSSDTALLVAARDQVEASALHFTPEELDSVAHAYELTPRDETILSVDYGSKGTGTATCGPGVLDAYKLPVSQVYNWEYTLIPVSASADASALNEEYRSFHNADVFDRDAYDKEAAAALIEKIDSFVAYDYSQLPAVKALQKDVQTMPESQAALVNADKDRSALVDEYVKQVESFETQQTYLQDQSQAALQVPYDALASFKKADGNIVMRGALPVASEALDDLFAGTNSWSVEVTVTPTGADGQKMLAGKGDYTFALRSQGSASAPAFSFHISDGSSWYATTYTMNAAQAASWLNNEHKVVGIYDGEAGTLSIYLDGELCKTASVGKVQVHKTDLPFSIGRCPSTGRSSDGNFARTVVYNRALSAAEVRASYEASETALQPEDDSVALWMDLSDIRHRDAVEIESVTLSPAAATLEAGQSALFVLSSDTAGGIIRSADWSVTDSEGNAADFVIRASEKGDRAEISVPAEAEAGVYTVRAARINGREDLEATAELTVEEKVVITTVLKDQSASKLDTELPETAVLTEGEEGKENGAVRGWFTVTDPDRLIDAAVTGGPFTVSTRFYATAAAFDRGHGVLENGRKYNMIASLGDNTFAVRLNTNSSDATYLDAYIYDGSTWVQIDSEISVDAFADAWHTVTVSHDGTAMTLYLDGTAVASDEMALPASSGKELEIGWMSDKSTRRSELDTASVKVFSQALTPEEIEAAAAEDENTVYWLDLGTEETPEPEKTADKRLLEAAVNYALDQKASAEYAHVNGIVKEFFEAALSEAQAVLNDADATQEEVNAAWSKLSSAVHYLSFTSNKELLASLTEQAEAMEAELDQYTGDKENFLTALENARDVLASDTALDARIEDACRLLQAAMDGLNRKPAEEIDTHILELLVSMSEKAEAALDDYVEAGQAEFLSALEAARDVLADPKDQKSVDDAAAVLHEAYLNLRLKADESILEELRSFVALYEAMDPSLFSAEELTLLQGTYDMISLALDNHELKSPELDLEAGTRLLGFARTAADLITGRVPLPSVDKDLLHSAIRDAMNKEEALYTPESWSVLQEALDRAKAIADSKEATQQEVDAAQEALKAAAEGLEAVQTPTQNPGQNNPGSSSQTKPSGSSSSAGSSTSSSVKTGTSAAQSVKTAAALGTAGLMTSFAAAGAGLLALLKRRKNR